RGSDGGDGGWLRFRNILILGATSFIVGGRGGGGHAVEPNVEVEVDVLDGVQCDLGTREVSLLAVAVQL
ncbi:unnamed protein product, partial [Musa banksii]